MLKSQSQLLQADQGVRDIEVALAAQPAFDNCPMQFPQQKSEHLSKKSVKGNACQDAALCSLGKQHVEPAQSCTTTNSGADTKTAAVCLALHHGRFKETDYQLITMI